MKIQVGKKELSEKQKKILRKVKVILQYVFIFLSLLIATTVAWVFRTWKGLTMEEVYSKFRHRQQEQIRELFRVLF